ncbi:MAG TPA: Ig-like domain-containing protein, partial [Gemmatimonadaceae bacterium]
MQKLTRSLFALGVLAGLAACGDDVSVTEPVITPAVTGITVSPDAATLIKGQTAQLSAVVTTNDASVAKTVNWASSNAAVASVSATGLVTALTPGAATITATSTADANFRAGAQITVTGSGVRSIRVSPDNAIVATGATLQLVANVDADAGVARTVTWTSSNTAVATVSETGVVTGVTAGTVTISAASTVDATVTGAAAITVRNPVPATISISSVTFGTLNTPVNENNVFGQIEVTLNVDPGDQIISKVDVLIDGNVACSQSFTVSRNEELALSHVFANVQAAPVTCSINTAAFNATTGVPTYLNGARSLSASATLQGGTSVATPSKSLVFNNANTYVAQQAFGETDSVATATSGLSYRRGSLDFTILPVIYSSGLSLASGTVTFGSGACDASGEGARATALVAPTSGNAWTATLAQTAVTGANNDVANYEFSAAACPVLAAFGEQPRISATDNAGNTLFANMQPNDSVTRQGIRLDNRAPGAPTYMANPNIRQNGWLNASVGLNGSNTSMTDNDWLVNGAADAGVGGYTRMQRIAAATGGLVDDALAATASSAATLPAPSLNNNDWCSVISATDALGNESALPAAGSTCTAPPVLSFTAVAAQSLAFGVDIAPPTIAFSGGLASN